VPAIKPACASSKTKRVSVLGTKGTVQREYTKKLIADFAQGCEVTLIGAENLAALAEAELKGEIIGDAAIAAEIAPCFNDGKSRTDTVVLACTHYPLLMERLIALAPWPVEWIDPAPAIARRVSDLLGPRDNGAESHAAQMIFTSGQSPSPSLIKALQPFFGASIAI
jgi:glutamate racemase